MNSEKIFEGGVEGGGITIYRLAYPDGRVCFTDESGWCLFDTDEEIEAYCRMKQEEVPPLYENWEHLWNARKELLSHMYPIFIHREFAAFFRNAMEHPQSYGLSEDTASCLQNYNRDAWERLLSEAEKINSGNIQKVDVQN